MLLLETQGSCYCEALCAGESGGIRLHVWIGVYAVMRMVGKMEKKVEPIKVKKILVISNPYGGNGRVSD